MKNKSKKRIFDIAVIAVFFAASAFFALAGIFTGEAEGSRESLSQAPVLRLEDGGINPHYTEELSNYFGDNFAFRSELIDANSRLLTGLLKSSPVDKVIYGREGWLFFSETSADYLGVSDFTPRESYSAARSLCLMQEYAESRGASFLFVSAPNKNSLYGDFMPYEGALGSSRLDDFLSELSAQGVRFADLKGALTHDETLYLKNDSHWNMLGAAIAADTLNAALGNEARFEPHMTQTTSSEGGDLFEMLYPESSAAEPDFEYAPGFGFEYVSNFRSPEDMSIETQKPGAEGSVLMFRDSFGNSLYGFIAESYGKAFFSRSNSYRLDLIDAKQADAVIIELVERNLDYLLKYPAVFPAPERFLTEKAQNATLTLELGLEESELMGYIKLAGSVGSEIDTNSPIYLAAGEKIYEASPAGALEGAAFTAFIPEGSNTDELSLLVYIGGVLTRCKMAS